MPGPVPRSLSLAALLVVLPAILLGGCTLVGSSTPASTPTPSSSSPADALGELIPTFPASFTDATAEKETARVADAIQALIAKTDIVHVDDHSQMVAATDTSGRYYGVLRTITVATGLDPITQATAMGKLLETAGWIERQKANDTGSYLIAMSSDPDGAKSWFVILGGDSTDTKASVVTIQIASPDFPEK
jgi:hypothetical protein